MLNLDTHVLLFAVVGDLDQREQRLLSSRRWSISAIVLWEIANSFSWGASPSISKTRTSCAY